MIYVVWVMSSEVEGSDIEPFAVGSPATWPLVSPQGYAGYLTPFIGEEEVSKITRAIDSYGGLQRVTGTVLAIKKLYGEQGLRPGSQIGGRPIQGSGRFLSVQEAVRWEEKIDGLEFIGYVVDFEVAEPGV